MRMTTPNEFLQFAKEMGLGRIKSSSSSSSPSRSISNNDGCTTTGLSVLNNLCRLIEQIHELKAENHRLRAHLDLVEHVDRFQQHFLSKTTHENKKETHKQSNFSRSIHDEDKSGTLSPTNSLKFKRTPSHREQKSINFVYNQEDSSSILPIDHEQSELNDNNLNSQSTPTWNKVRHALKFTLRKKQDTHHSPPLSHIERQIPTISVSIESDDEQLQDNKCLKKKKKIQTINDNRQTNMGEDTDQDDESTQFVKAYHKKRLDGNETSHSSSTDRQETASAVSLQYNATNPDDEHLLIRKQSKIARYRRKLRSKLDTVKRQFSDQNSSSSSRLFHNSHGSTFDDIGSGINHALLTAQLAPALTKSYQQKMREWETMQKSQFLVNYRRQSITPKMDLNNNSRKTSVAQPTNETSNDQTNLSSPMDNLSSAINDLKFELETNLNTLGPILSPNQRSLIVHQWREIMSEEISLRYYNEYLEKKMILLRKLETNLKNLKTNIFCTNHFLKQRSMINLQHETKQSQQSYLLQRSHSVQSFITMPASWILAVQSAAYSDVLDGTSYKTSERAIIFNKDFFDRLEYFKCERFKFEQDSINDLHLLTHSKKISNENQSKPRPLPLRGCLRKLSLISSTEFPQHFLPDPIIPLQTRIALIPPISSVNEQFPTTINLNKQTKHSRFDLKKSFQRSRSMYMTQFHSWLQRRRQQNSSNQRRKSAIESKVPTPCSTPKLLGSPRLARLREKFFKPSPSPSPERTRRPIPVHMLDDSDHRSQIELPVRIYFPPLTPPTVRHVHIKDTNINTSNNDNHDIQIEETSILTTPILNRKYASSSSSTSTSFRMTTAKERRESFATLSNIFNNRYL